MQNLNIEVKGDLTKDDKLEIHFRCDPETEKELKALLPDDQSLETFLRTCFGIKDTSEDKTPSAAPAKVPAFKAGDYVRRKNSWEFSKTTYPRFATRECLDNYPPSEIFKIKEYDEDGYCSVQNKKYRIHSDFLAPVRGLKSLNREILKPQDKVVLKLYNAVPEKVIFVVTDIHSGVDGEAMIFVGVPAQKNNIPSLVLRKDLIKVIDEDAFTASLPKKSYGYKGPGLPTFQPGDKVKLIFPGDENDFSYLEWQNEDMRRMIKEEKIWTVLSAEEALSPNSSDGYVYRLKEGNWYWRSNALSPVEENKERWFWSSDDFILVNDTTEQAKEITAECSSKDFLEEEEEESLRFNAYVFSQLTKTPLSEWIEYHGKMVEGGNNELAILAYKNGRGLASFVLNCGDGKQILVDKQAVDLYPRKGR